MQSMMINKIENQMERLTKAEKKVAQYVLNHAELVPTMTIRELSSHAGASEASVVRFCKSIGMSNFQSLKLALVRDITRSDMNISDFSVIKQQDAPYELFQKVQYHNKTAIEEMSHSLDKKELEKAVEAILMTRNVIFYGLGGSSVVALDACHKFRKIGYHSESTTDFHMMLPVVSNMKPGEVLVAISVTGSTKELVEIVRFAKKKQAIIIAITNGAKSPLYKEADIRLCTPDIEQDFRVGSIASRIMHLTIIDALYVSIFNRIGESVLDRFTEIRQEVLKYSR
ncbi:MurR/RpiR family transcriptional regulator [Brevibacillus daliensis]|uniref:MurR/RpiR family transcriptional regulator n=1 Tax=Brevibacillus daliensis TaxID=2892995 RepID=UPI001E3DB27E|nr:MurR/RpiR family transcriptional regulator [Brevibacillus daliensis]